MPINSRQAHKHAGGKGNGIKQHLTKCLEFIYQLNCFCWGCNACTRYMSWNYHQVSSLPALIHITTVNIWYEQGESSQKCKLSRTWRVRKYTVHVFSGTKCQGTGKICSLYREFIISKTLIYSIWRKQAKWSLYQGIVNDWFPTPNISGS